MELIKMLMVDCRQLTTRLVHIKKYNIDNDYRAVILP